MIAAAQGHAEVVRILLRYGPDVNMVDKFGRKAHEKSKTAEIAILIQEAAITAKLEKTVGDENDDENPSGYDNSPGPKTNGYVLTSSAKKQLRELSNAHNTQLLNAFIQKMHGKLHRGVLENIINDYQEYMSQADSLLREDISELLSTETKDTMSHAIDLFNSAMLEIVNKHGVNPGSDIFVTEEDLEKGMKPSYRVSEAPATAFQGKSLRKSSPIRNGADLVSSIGARLELIGISIMSDLQEKLHGDVSECMETIRESIRTEVKETFCNFRKELENTIGSLMKEKVIRVSKQIKDRSDQMRKRCSNVEVENTKEVLTARASPVEAHYKPTFPLSPREGLRTSHTRYSSTRPSSSMKKRVENKPAVEKNGRKSVNYQYVVQHSAKVRPSTLSHSGKKPGFFMSMDICEKLQKATIDSSGVSANKTKEVFDSHAYLASPTDYRAKMMQLERKCKALARLSENNSTSAFDLDNL